MKKQARTVLEFDLLPQTEPMNPLFEPVMIRRHDKEDADERDQRSITSLVPGHLVQRDGAEQSSDKEDESPPGKGGTRRCAAGEQALDSPDYASQRPFSR
jgi:hypothetical protein